MVVGHHLAEAIDVFPDPLDVGVEDVGPVLVDHHPGLAVTGRVAIAGDVVAGFEDDDLVPFLGKLAANDRPRESGTNYPETQSQRLSVGKSRIRLGAGAGSRVVPRIAHPASPGDQCLLHRLHLLAATISRFGR